MSFANSLYRTKITIAASQVAIGQLDFPLLLTEFNVPSELLDTTSGQSCLSGGGDLLVSTDVGGSNRLALDIRDCSPGVGSGTLTARTSVPSVSSIADTDVYLWWGDPAGTQPAAGDPYGRNAVYGSSYDAVWAFEADPSGGAPQLVDRTGGGGDGTTQGSMTSGDLVTGKIGKAWEFDGVDDCVAVAAGTITPGVGTISFWYDSSTDVESVAISASKGTVSGEWFGIICGGNPTGSLTNELITITKVTTGLLVNYIVGYESATRTELIDGNPHNIRVVFHGGSTKPDIYLDGVAKTVTVGVKNIGIDYEMGFSGADTSRVGCVRTNSTDVFPLNGILDEMLVVTDILDANDVLTHYRNENAPGTFASDDGVTVLGGVTPFPFYYWYQ